MKRQYVPILCILNCQLSQPGIFAKTNPSSHFFSIWQTDSKDYREPLSQGLVKYSPWTQSSPPVVFENKVLLAHSHAHSFLSYRVHTATAELSSWDTDHVAYWDYLLSGSLQKFAGTVLESKFHGERCLLLAPF